MKRDPYEEAYAGSIRRRKDLENGWRAIVLYNRFAVLFKHGCRDITAGGIKKIVEAKDGKFMLVKTDKRKAVFAPDGQMICNFDKKANLFFNGWYVFVDDKDVSLCDEKGDCICTKLKKALVLKDGKYFISVNSGGDATKVGLFDVNGSLIYFSNDGFFKCFYPFFFIADGSLFSLKGKCLIDANSGSAFNRRLVRCIGKILFWKS